MHIESQRGARGDILPAEPPRETGRRPRRKYSARFKTDAVRRIVEGAESVSAAARDLGIARSTLSRWKRDLGSLAMGDPSIREWTSIDLGLTDDAPTPLTEPATASDPEEIEAAPALDESPQIELILEPWEPTAVRATLRGDSEAGDWSSLIDETVATQRDRFGEICRLQDAAPRPEEELIDQLIGEVSISLSLIKDTQDAIDRVIHSGQMARAKQLTGFRVRLRQGLSAIAERIGTDAIREAQSRADAMCAESPADRPVLRTVADRDPRSRRPARPSRRPRRPVRPAQPFEARRRIRPLLLALAASVLVWLVVGLPRLRQEPLPVLALDDFRHVSGISDLRARPPSLFVVLDADNWNALSYDERRRLIERVGLTAGNAGYWGAHYTDSEGQPVARWLRRSGAKLVDEPSAATVRERREETARLDVVARSARRGPSDG